VLAVQAACNLDLYEGDVASASRRLEEAWPAIERIGALRLQQLRIELLALRARVALADASRPLDERGRLARTISEDLIKEGAPWAIGVGMLVRAAALYAQGRDASVLASLAAAEEQLAATGMIGWLHVARLRHGLLDGGPGGVARAEAARDLLNDLGAADPDRVAGLLVPWPA
jgi:hypothetical protein